MPSSTSPQTQILLLGAGELGTALLTHLALLPNTHLTIGTRTPSNYPHLVTHNTDLRNIDLTSSSSKLSEQFSQYDIVISATGFASAPGSVIKLADEALHAASLRKARGENRLWFFPWQWGVDYDITLDGQGLMPLFGEQKSVRDLLRSKAEDVGLKWTIVSTGIFMSFLFEPFWGIIDRSREDDEGMVVVRALGSWEHGVTVTDVNDIGRVLVRIVRGDVERENRVLCVAGDTVRYGELASIVEKVSGKVVQREEWDMQYLEEEVKSDPEDGIKKYRLVFARDGVWWEKDKSVNAALGMTMMSVEDYAKKIFVQS